MKNQTAARPGVVYLVGAGPGDPELLTMRAVNLLATADVIFHDDLVPEQVIALAGAEALITSVGKRCGRPRITQAGIHLLMVEAARAGQSVVRLKSGDPMIFGRAGEELAALRTAGIPCEVVPGVTAALAAGAALQLPLTDRSHASHLILTTGHHAADKDAADPFWNGSLPQNATVVVYMPGRDLAKLQRDLRQAGMSDMTPYVAISHVATERQDHVAGRLADMHLSVHGPAPLLLVIGPATKRLLEDQHFLQSLLPEERPCPPEAQNPG